MERLNKTFRFYASMVFSVVVLGSGVADVRGETVSPSAVVQIVLNMPAQQAVGHPWAGPVQLLLLDENLGLVTAYDLSADPITLTVSDGVISPAVISDSLLFSGGVIDLTPLGIIYQGRSGSVTITAANSSISSSSVLVTFNGCDISKVIGLSIDTVATVYSGLTTLITAVTVHAGDLMATARPTLKTYFKSGGGSVIAEFDAGGRGGLDTVAINLPTSGLVPGADTLMVITERVFDLGSGDLVTGDTLRFSVQVMPSGGLTVVPGSLRPDSVYASVLFDLAWSVVADGIQPPYDSAVGSVSLMSDTDSVLAVVLKGAIEPYMTFADTLFYRDLPAIVSAVPDLPAGAYKLRTDYRLYLGGLTLVAVDPGGDSLFIIDPPALGYVESSLVPGQIASGAEAEFQFELYLDESEALHLHPELSNFEIYSDVFSVSVQLAAARDSLFPGGNLIHSGKLHVPEDLLGTDLSARATVTYHHPGSGNQLVFETGFSGETITVQAVPLVKVVEATIMAPNSPKVNVGQAFQILCRVANVSTTDSDPVELILASDGASPFDSLRTTAAIAAGDTTEVYFDVVAAPPGLSGASEIFRIEIAPFTVGHLLPDDNVAMATVQRPAELTITLHVIGADDDRVDVGEGFDLLIGLVNSGEGEASAGRFRINTNSVYLGLPGGALVVEEVISVGSVRRILLEAPDFDTMVVINVDLVEQPIDFNSGLPALIGNAPEPVELAITSQVLTLNVELAEVASNLVVAGESKELFRLQVTNPGFSSVSDIALESMSFSVKERGEALPRVRSLIEVGSTGLFDDDQMLTRATAGEDRIKLSFNDFVVAAGQTVDLSFRTKSLTEADTEFSIVLEAEDIVASYAAGPLAGQAVAVRTPDDDQAIVEEIYTAVLGDLEGSLVVRNNPYDPMSGPAEFRYYLERAQQMRFTVLTLSGELVHEEVFEADEIGGRAGENTLFWNGHNDHGWMVLNGVYIIVVSNESGRERAILKLAVMK